MYIKQLSTNSYSVQGLPHPNNCPQADFEKNIIGKVMVNRVLKEHETVSRRKCKHLFILFSHNTAKFRGGIFLKYFKKSNNVYVSEIYPNPIHLYRGVWFGFVVVDVKSGKIVPYDKERPGQFNNHNRDAPKFTSFTGNCGINITKTANYIPKCSNICYITTSKTFKNNSSSKKRFFYIEKVGPFYIFQKLSVKRQGYRKEEDRNSPLIKD